LVSEGFGFFKRVILKGFYFLLVAKEAERRVLLEFVDSMGKEIKFFERDVINSR